MMKITALSFLLLMIFISPVRAQGGAEGNAASPKDQEKPEVIDDAGQMTDTQAGSSKHVSIDAFELDEVNVVGNTPIGTIGLGQNKVSGNVQTYEDEEINRHDSILFPDFLNRRLESVNINDVQNNPYQPDITYRGFEASPILGTPIGISVYQDGVRINESFGDTVNWDLIPQIAIANMEMVPGSNPLFGLNIV